MPKKLPIGVESFKVLSKECYFVDKTRFIEEVADFPSTTVLLFTRPRRFGKSTNLSMAKCFFEISDDDPLPYFSSTYIVKSNSPALSEMGKYPVISLSFKNLSPKNYQEMLMEIGHIIKLEFLRHNEEFEKGNLSKIDKEDIARIIEERADKIQLSHSLGLLMRLLSKLHNIGVIVLIDEYDALMQEAYDKRFSEDAISFFKTFYGTALKGNDHLRLCLLTGVFEIAKDSLSSSLNNPLVFTVLDTKFSSYFGFTIEETEELLTHYGHQDKLEEALSWYDGYRFGETNIINPWSILNFLYKDGKTAAYWTNTSKNAVLGDALFSSSFAENVLPTLLSTSDGVSANIDTTISYGDLPSSRSLLLSALLFLGYVTIKKELDVGQYIVKIPNREVESIFQNEILDRFYPTTGTDTVLDFRRYLSEGNELGIKKILEESLLSCLNYYDFSSEKTYQGMVLCMVSLAYKDALVESEALSGTGRCDILLTPNNRQNPGVCIELKRLQTRTTYERLQTSSRQALSQIKSRDYGDRLRRSGVKRILYYGISFFNKTVAITFEKEER